jgi:uncharacterized membrane-anchored protein YhcB (DUF1043 family)
MDFSDIVVGGLVAAVVPTFGGVLAFMRFTGKVEEKVDGLRRDFEKLEDRLETYHQEIREQFKEINQNMFSLGERIATLEARSG